MKGIIYTAIALSIIGGLYAGSHKTRDFGSAKLAYSQNQAEINQGDRVIVWKGNTKAHGSDGEVLAAVDTSGSPEGGGSPVPVASGSSDTGDRQNQAMDSAPEAGETSRATPATVVQIVDYIHLAESSRGKNSNPYALHNVCKAKGKSNEYGYGGMQSMLCYDSHEQAGRIVSDRVTRLLETYEGNVAKALCTYNLGYDKDSDGKQIPYINCKYYQRFIGAI